MSLETKPPVNPNPMFDAPVDPRQIKEAQEAAQLQLKVIEMQRLCYEIFHMTPEGRRLYEIYQERFIIPCLVNPATATPTELGYWEGFKEALRGQFFNGQAHKERIAGVNG